MADKRLTYELTANDNASREFAKVATVASGSANDISKSYKKSSDDSKKHVSGLVTALAAVAPAAIPIGAVAAGAIAGLGATAGVAALGFLGIRDAMKSGTPIGREYAATFKPVTTEFEHLKQLAAINMFDGINAGVRSSQQLFPALNRDVASLSTQIGEIVGHVGPGLVSLFHAFEPLFSTIGDELVRGSAAFENWTASSTGVQTFVAYAQNQLPVVEHALSEVAVAVGHLIQGLAPLGGTSLSTIGVLARVINLIPINVLQTVIPLLAGTALGFKALGAASNAATGIAGFAGRLESAGGVAAKAGGAVSTFGKVVGFMGPIGLVAGAAIGVLSSVLGRQSEQQAKATAEVNNYTQALQASNGVIDDNVRAITAKNLQDAGAFDAAKKLGIGLDTVTSAALGNKTAQEQVNAVLAQYPNNTQAVIDASGLTEKQFRAMFIAAGDVKNAIGAQSTELDKGKQKQLDMAAATSTAAAQQAQAKVTIDGVTTAINKQTTASGLLKSAFDRLNGTALSVEQTENTFLDTLGNLKKAQDAGTRSIDQNSAKGRVNREVLVQAIVAANDAAQATADQTAKTRGLTAGLAAGQASLAAHEGAIRRAAAAAGLDRGQVDALIRSLGRVPRSITSNINVNTGTASRNVAGLLAVMNNLHSKAITIDVYQTVHSIGAPNAGAGGHLALPHASGGYLSEGWNTAGEGSATELMYKQGSSVKVLTNEQSKPLLNAGGGGGDTYQITVKGVVMTVRDLARELEAEINIRRKRRGLQPI